MSHVPDEAIRKMEAALKDFGYPLDFAYVRKSVDDLMGGARPVGGPQGFMCIWLQEANLLPKGRA